MTTTPAPRYAVVIDPPYEDQDGRPGTRTITCESPADVRTVLDGIALDLMRLDPGQVPYMVEIARLS